jgi:hypothetical protein
MTAQVAMLRGESATSAGMRPLFTLITEEPMPSARQAVLAAMPASIDGVSPPAKHFDVSAGPLTLTGSHHASHHDVIAVAIDFHGAASSPIPVHTGRIESMGSICTSAMNGDSPGRGCPSGSSSPGVLSGALSSETAQLIIPEPSGLLVIGGGAMVLLRRRRQARKSA